MFKNRVAQVKLVKEKDEPDYEGPRQPKPTVDEVAEAVIVAYIFMKGFSTLCSAVEHIVVTKVK